MAMSRALKRYNRRVIILSLIYAVFLIAAVYLFKHQLLSGPIAWVAAVLPALPIVAILFTVGRYLTEETDEYLRLMMTRQALIASAFTLSIATVWGFLESFELVAHVESYYVAVLWFGGLGLGACANKLTLGRAV